METLIDYMLRNLYEYRRMGDIIRVDGQHDFPNCEKYKPHCCSEIPQETMERMQEETNLRHRVYKVRKQEIKPEPKPEDFNGW